jgi:hypothetical protein
MFILNKLSKYVLHTNDNIMINNLDVGIYKSTFYGPGYYPDIVDTYYNYTHCINKQEIKIYYSLKANCFINDKISIPHIPAGYLNETAIKQAPYYVITRHIQYGIYTEIYKCLDDRCSVIKNHWNDTTSYYNIKGIFLKTTHKQMTDLGYNIIIYTKNNILIEYYMAHVKYKIDEYKRV